MTIRQRKQVILAAAVVVGLGVAINLGLWAFHDAFDPRRITPILAPVTVTAPIAALWSKLRRLEAEHGPDYELPVPASRRTLILLALTAGAFAALGGFVLATHL